MAFRKKLPRHRADGQPVYVDPFDQDAWDVSRINDEVAAMERRNAEVLEGAPEGGTPELEDSKDHPFAVYNSGRSRYQLDAPSRFGDRDLTPREYLKPGAWQFKLRRLDWRQYHEVHPLLTAKDEVQSRRGKLLACRYGLTSIEGPGAPSLDPADGVLTDADMQALHDLDPNLPLRVGTAVFLASLPLTDAEGKA